MAWVEAKKIKKGVYLYLRWRDDGGTHSKYLGKAGQGWQVGMTKTIAWKGGNEPLPAGALEPPSNGNGSKPAPAGWPVCVCCRKRPAQMLYKGEPVCYQCAHYMRAHDDDCP